jgi:hypothetical protein
VIVVDGATHSQRNRVDTGIEINGCHQEGCRLGLHGTSINDEEQKSSTDDCFAGGWLVVLLSEMLPFSLDFPLPL